MTFISDLFVSKRLMLLAAAVLILVALQLICAMADPPRRPAATPTEVRVDIRR
jgi:hypothetical protein